MARSLKKRNGFTLVEMVIVIGVLAILSTGAVVAFTNVQGNARRTTLQSDANALAAAINNFNAQLIGNSVANDGNLLAQPLALTTPTDWANEDLPGISPVPTAEPWTITFRIPQRGVAAAQINTVSFESQNHMTRAINFIDYTEIVAGETRHASASIVAIGDWNDWASTARPTP